jgi:molybdopterin/thiamine biosynthesis adenylyltransferase
MADPVLKITPAQLAAADSGEADRFARFKLIGWWDQARLAAAKVLVVGAGALGNEIIKNLALLGVGNVLIADRDRIEHSNLSRSVLYREADIGAPKALVAARAARELFPQMNVHAFDGDVLHALGAGVFRWADVVIGGLDNREARLHINRQCWRLGKPWIDGAIEQIQGVARVFVPDAAQAAPCYECTMSARDWQLLAQRRSCNMLTRAQMEAGRTPTTPTISAIIAGIQTQEAVKLLHGLETLAGRGLTFVGATSDCFAVEYQRRADCLSHETFAEVIDLPTPSSELSVRDLLSAAREAVGPDAVLELGRDIVERFDCPACRRSETVFAPLGTLSVGRAVCACDGQTVRTPILFHQVRGDEGFLDRACSEIGLPRFDVVGARAGERFVGLAFAADAADVLGPLAEGGLTWT